MFAHHVIEDLETTLRTRKISSALYRDGIKLVIENIKNAQKFFLGEFQDFKIALEKTFTKNVALFNNECSQFTRMPYKICFFEFTNNFKDVRYEDDCSKRCILAFEIDPNTIFVWIVNYVNSMAMWVLSLNAYIISIGKTLSENSVFLDLLQRERPLLLNDKLAMEKLQKGNILPMPLLPFMASEIINEFTNDDQRDLYVLNSALVLLNCKNIETEQIFPNKKINKKRRKNGKQELFTYKILKLNLPSTRGSTPDIGKPIAEEARRIHLCRGHFKIFTDKKPLFRKHTGVYWWQPHLRGNNKLGFVRKDYQCESRRVIG